MKNLLMNNGLVRKVATSKVFAGIASFLMTIAVPVVAFASEASVATTAAGVFDGAVNPVIELINTILTPILGIVGAVGAIYCVILGVKYAKAEDPQEHEKAKNHLKNAIIGFVLIFVLMLGLKLGMKGMREWYETSLATTTAAGN